MWVFLWLVSRQLRKHAGLLECAIPSLHLAEIEIVALEVVLWRCLPSSLLCGLSWSSTIHHWFGHENDAISKRGVWCGLNICHHHWPMSMQQNCLRERLSILVHWSHQSERCQRELERWSTILQECGAMELAFCSTWTGQCILFCRCSMQFHFPSHWISEW